MKARYEGEGDLKLTEAEKALLRANGFEPWGEGGWVRFAEGEFGGTCYDNRWAMQEALSNPGVPNNA